MSSERAGGAVGRGLSPHGAVYRVPEGAVPDEGAAAGVRLWRESVAGAWDGSVAERRRAAELHAPLGGAGVRAVLLEYADGVRDLVLVGDRPLDAVAAALLGDLRSAEVLPVPAPLDGSLAALRVELPGATVAADLAAAFALVLARSCGAERPVLDVHEDGTYTALLPGEADEDRTVAEYRTRAAAPRPAGDTATDARGTAPATDTDPASDAGGTAPDAGGTATAPATDADPASDAGGTGTTPATGTDGTAPDTGGTRFALRTDPHPHHLPPLDPRHALTVHTAESSATATAWYRPQQIPTWRAGTLVRQLHTAYAELTSGAQDRPLAELDVIGAAERRRILDLGATPRTPVRRRGTLHEQVFARAAADPHAVALVDGDTTVTYRSLVRRAGRLAHALRELGVAPGDRVGVCLDRGAELVVVLLAVLTAGAVYVPLDPTSPADRLASTAQDAGLNVVLVDTADGAAPFEEGTAVPLARLHRLAADAPEEPPVTGAGPDDPAYVIYTSGSTGRPKGVVVPHRNVSDLLSATETDFGLGPGDVWSWFHSAAFDFSVWEIWGCLLTGGRLVVVPYWTCRSPEDFRDLLSKERVTVLNQTPSAFARLLELERAPRPAPLDVRLVIFGGEPLDARSLTPWFDAHPESACRVVNMFGITETTVHVTAQTVTRAEALTASRSVGRAIPGWSVRVLDGRGRLLPPGSPGEIAVAGDGVALAYLNRPELTARRFVPDPDDPDGTGRLYLSGDLGALLPDGRLEHLGRLDDQVKVRGYRIELGEIRNVLLTHEAVVAAAVVLGRDASGEVRLDAYAVLDGADTGEVRRHAARLLPEYMMPTTLTRVDALPLTVNGKVDTARLPAPETTPAGAAHATELHAPKPHAAPTAPEGPTAPEASEAPAGPAVPAVSAVSAVPAVPVTPDVPAAPGDPALDGVLAVWRELFHAEVGPDDDFFHLGGNSLLALRIVRLLKDRDLVVGVREVYRLRTPAAVARFAAGS
ncbi:amino acid adenylation domain-containing protein [Streptomyces sp. ISL-36]|uniref:amino acid adenylation domain-containing protein n=1 Tax=Streptomyces sp. ISL-36 TaxID=2819182 RepID=UPI001BEB0E6B|nr:amino acid adenylation domain-containing protein [Streptomyces sp. ISL-36]MBT2440941.1 amino acid adenylation domain-containing protein [Streptomyces sp. ISL-36]